MIKLETYAICYNTTCIYIYILYIYIHRKCHANCKLSKSQFPALSKSSCGFQLKSPQLVGIVDGINGPLISGFCGYGGSRHFLWKLQHEESVSEYTVFLHWALSKEYVKNKWDASINHERNHVWPTDRSMRDGKMVLTYWGYPPAKPGNGKVPSCSCCFAS